jgi:hypothetical protein
VDGEVDAPLGALAVTACQVPPELWIPSLPVACRDPTVSGGQNPVQAALVQSRWDLVSAAAAVARLGFMPTMTLVARRAFPEARLTS